MKTYIDEDIDIVFKTRDHFPLIMEVLLKQDGEKDLVVRRKTTMSRSATTNPDNVSGFIREMWWCPRPHWMEHNHDTQKQVFEYIRYAAQKWFPIEIAGKRKPYMADDTWAAILTKKGIRKHIEVIKTAGLKILRRVAFAVLRWHGDKKHDMDALKYMPQVMGSGETSVYAVKHQLDVKAATTIKTFNEQRDRVRGMTIRDRNKHFTDLAKDAQVAAEANNTTELYRIVKQITPKSKRPPPRLEMEDGTIAATPLQARKRWQRFFVDKLGGHITTFEILLQKVLDRQVTVDVSEDGLALDVKYVPAFQEMVEVFKLAKPRKGHGEDTLPYELSLACPEVLAYAIYPVWLKLFLRLEHPLTWKGGMLAELYKGNGSVSKCENFRDILVSDAGGKQLNTWLRMLLQPCHLGAARPQQYGGVKNKGTDMAAHAARSFWSFTRSRKLSAAQLFLDVIGAFGSLIRELMFGDMGNDEEVARVLAAHGFGPEMMHKIAQRAKQEAVLPAMGISAYFNTLLKEVHQDSWSTTQGLSDIFTTTTGTKPGDPLGSIIFDMMVTEVTSEIEKEASLQGLLFVMPPLQGMQLKFHDGEADLPMMDDTYADDTILFIADKQPTEVPKKAAAITAIAVQVYGKHGLRLNFKENKSEVMLNLSGHGAKEAYRSLAIDDDGNIDVFMPSGPIAVRVIVAYRHMGGQLNTRGDMGPEAKARAGAATGVIRPVKKKVFGNTDIKIDVRLSLAKSLSFSRLLYNAGTWDTLSPAAARLIRRSYMQTLRTVARMHNTKTDDAHTTDLQVLASLEEPQVEVVMMVHRLRYLVRLIRYGPPALIRVVMSQHTWTKSWVRKVIADLAEFQNKTTNYQHMPSPSTDPDIWFNDIYDNPVAYKNAFVRFQKKWSGKAFIFEDVEGDKVAVDSVFACTECSAHFDSEQKLLSHKYKKHNYRNPLHYKISGTSCVRCGVDYHTRQRLYRHVSRRLEKNACAKHYAEQIEAHAEYDHDWLMEAEKVDKATKLPSRRLKPPPIPSAY